MSGRHSELIDPNLDLPELPPVHDTTLGFKALDYGNIALQSANQGTEAEVEHMTQLFDELGSVRERLKNLTPHQKGIADDYLKQYFADSPTKNHTSLTEWLSDEKSASDSTLFDFLQRHAEELAFQQHSEETQLMIKELKTDYIDGVKAAHADGWLADTMVSKLSQVENADIVIGDVWDTIISGVKAYHTPNKHRRFVVVGQSLNVVAPHEDLKKNLELATWHELIHLQTGYMQAPWLTEAGTEHINQSLKYGQFDVIDPRLRHHEAGAYQEERQLLAGITQLGRRSVPPKLVTRAFSSADLQSRGWQEFSDAVDQSWGLKNTLHRVKQRIAIYGFHLQREDKMRVEGERAAGHMTFPKDENTLRVEAVVRMIAEVERSRRDKEPPSKKPQQVGAAAMGRTRVQL